MIRQTQAFRKGARTVALCIGLGGLVTWITVGVALNFREDLYYQLHPFTLVYYIVIISPIAIFSALMTYGLTKSLSIKDSLLVMLVAVPPVSIAGWWLMAILSIARYGL
ncbi:hypothetical protein CL689_00660 [Candidatus Saccharibacteria bacterium]|nr:hypothetical protein [Candidatus Saccharibacteria bacterium]MBQ68561.1 hypothetical protein [Candidatus Saccharibacteria bacterium]|tara:strand:+ start:496 stop:822 length:327 start_codon:yes stop_codon:yes gene_type:complete